MNLSLAFRLLETALLLVPILTSLGISGWDIRSATLPSQTQLDRVAGAVGDVLGGGFSSDTFTPVKLGRKDNLISLTILFRSPFKVPVKIVDFSISFHVDGGLITLDMVEGEIEVPAGGSANLTLVGAYRGPVNKLPQFAGFRMRMEVLGLAIELKRGV